MNSTDSTSSSAGANPTNASTQPSTSQEGWWSNITHMWAKITPVVILALSGAFGGVAAALLNMTPPDFAPVSGWLWLQNVVLGVLAALIAVILLRGTFYAEEIAKKLLWCCVLGAVAGVFSKEVLQAGKTYITERSDLINEAHIRMDLTALDRTISQLEATPTDTNLVAAVADLSGRVLRHISQARRDVTRAGASVSIAAGLRAIEAIPASEAPSAVAALEKIGTTALLVGNTYVADSVTETAMRLSLPNNSLFDQRRTALIKELRKDRPQTFMGE